MSDDDIHIDGHTISLSNQDKLLFPQDGISKGDLVGYYRRIAEIAIPQYRGRPLTMHRFPDGIDAGGFFQKEAPDYFPDWIERATLDKEGGSLRQVIANDAATLVYLANQGCITPHLGLSTIDAIDRPDRMIIDLDPADDDFGKVQKTARLLRDFCDAAQIPSFVKSTGSKGLHVVVPLDRSASFDAVRACVDRLAAHLAKARPDDLTTEQRKAKRGDRVYLDTGRNAYGQTAVAPYAVRPLPGAPIATPLDWDEALAGDMHPQRYTLTNIFRRLGAKDDPWARIDEHAIPIDALEKPLDQQET
jgi:bifunctional non-homologous end joining protein LigD